jgi:hypothetical protein
MDAMLLCTYCDRVADMSLESWYFNECGAGHDYPNGHCKKCQKPICRDHLGKIYIINGSTSKISVQECLCTECHRSWWCCSRMKRVKNV